MNKRLFLLALPLLLLGTVTALVAHLAVSRAEVASDRMAAERLTLYRQTILGVYEKYRYLPYMIARDPRAIMALDDPSETEVANLFLEEMATNSGAAQLFVMDLKGDTVAASNWRSELSLIGRNYGFRPYFKSAIRGEEGQYFAVGMTTGLPGLFLARPTPVVGEPRGVAVVKVDTKVLERTWREGGETVYVTDENGVVFLSSVAAWRYRTTEQLAPAVLEEISAARQYTGNTLRSLAEETSGDPRLLRIDGVTYRHNAAFVGLLGWKLHYLVPEKEVSGAQTPVWISALGLALLYAVAVLFLRGRALRRASAILRQESAELKALNTRLTDEVEERRRVESELIRAQEGLARSSRLAAVGQMSAAVAHELNQPLAALRMFVAGTRKFLERDNLAAARENLDEIDGLQDRMANLTQELKRFARPAESRIERVDLRECVWDSVKIARPRFDETGVNLSVSCPQTPLALDTARYRVEQVLLNLLKNAADAANQAHLETGQGEVSLTAVLDGDRVQVSIADNGSGISKEDRARIFDPFFTTKLSSGGLGLGLSISMRIAEDLGGTLDVMESEMGGAEFVLSLPAAPDRICPVEQIESDEKVPAE